MVNYIAKANAARQARVSGTTLFQVAVDYLNDATQWYRIAQLNGISDPWINAIETLQLPASLPATAQGNGGVLGAQTPTKTITIAPQLAPVLAASIVAPTQMISLTGDELAAFLASLPTVLPTTPGTVWNNGGTVSITSTTAVAAPPPPPASTVVQTPSTSQPVTLAAFLSSLPTTLPSSPGIAWNNGGILSVS
jgi:hypothetical protein